MSALIPVDKLPEKTTQLEKKRGRHSLVSILDEFLQMDIPYAKIQMHELEYKSYRSAYNSIYNAIKNHRYNITVHSINRELYLVRGILSGYVAVDYDRFGRVNHSIDTNGLEVWIDRDDEGRITQIRRNDGYRMKWKYHQDGSVEKVYDQQGVLYEER